MLKWLLPVGLLALWPQPARADLSPPTNGSLTYYLNSGLDYNPIRGVELDTWEPALIDALKSMKPLAAADALAPRFGLKPAHMRELVTLWLYRRADLDRDKIDPTAERELRARFLRLVAASGRSPLVLEAAAAALMYNAEPCDSAQFAPLMAGSTDRTGDAWRIAHAAAMCWTTYAEFVAIAPDRALPALIDFPNELSIVDRVPLLAWLSAPEQLSRIDAAHRATVALHFEQSYITALVDAGQFDRAIAVYEGLTPDVQRAVWAGKLPDVTFDADGLPTALGASSDLTDMSLRVNLTSAYALTGRTDRAKALLARIPGLAGARANLACLTTVDRAAASKCEDWVTANEQVAALMLDQYLNHRDEDPYLIAEALFSGGLISGGSASVPIEIVCGIFAGPRFASICTRNGYVDEDQEARAAVLRPAIVRAGVTGYEQARAALIAAQPKVDATSDRQSFRDRPAAEPLPGPFPAMPLPADMQGKGAVIAWSKGWAPLPEGYEPVRIGRDGDRIAVISLSQNLDPTGEVSMGGYWVHLSTDGGKSWGMPLYTGLADRFPYVVVPDAKMPLFDGDALTIAVDEKLLDTRSISYPPVALRTLRSKAGLYVRIPIAELQRDSDGDGLTDLAARHLLIAGDASTPRAFLVGKSPGIPCTGDASLRAAMQAVLEKIFSGGTGALFEPVDRSPTAPLTIPRGADTNSARRPILIEGNPADYACLKPNRRMIVYGREQLDYLRRVTPDFHAVSLGPVVMNRAGDRGYLKWSTGWSGGTFRIRRVDGQWQIDETSSWIT